MRVAALNDTHGNLLALEAVRAEVEPPDPDETSRLFESRRLERRGS